MHIVSCKDCVTYWLQTRKKNYLVKIVFQAWPQVSIPFLFFSFSLTLWSISVVDGYRAKEKRGGKHVMIESSENRKNVGFLEGQWMFLLFPRNNQKNGSAFFTKKNKNILAVSFPRRLFFWPHFRDRIKAHGSASIRGGRQQENIYWLDNNFGSPLQPLQLPPNAMPGIANTENKAPANRKKNI